MTTRTRRILLEFNLEIRLFHCMYIQIASTIQLDFFFKYLSILPYTSLHIFRLHTHCFEY
jgi:hypothetical protein